MHGAQTISRKDSDRSENPQRLYARLRDEMRQSELHGDMQSQTDTIWPPVIREQQRTNGPKVAKFLVG
jgi:hypothetical protein